MTKVSIQFGAGGVSVERDFEVVPRVGDIVHINRDEEHFDLLIDVAQHSEGRDGGKMDYFVHGHVVDDMGAELARQMDRARSS